MQRIKGLCFATGVKTGRRAMGDFGRRRSRRVWRFLTSATVCLASGAALAQTVSAPYYVVVQPIDVCNSTGTSCAPINSRGGTVISSTGVNTPVGFFDPTSGANITQAIILRQIGVNVVFLPVVQYNSPNTNPLGGNFQTLHVQNSSTTASGQTSSDFLVLSQQPQISQNPVTPYKTTPPLSPNLTTINMFFVTTLVPPTPGQLYGFSWIGNNGIVISSNTMLGVPLLGLPARPDTLGHEIGHNLNLNHTTFGAGPGSNGSCGLACTANLMTAGGTAGMNLRTEPTIPCVLINPPSTTCAPQSLVNMTAAQLNLEAQENPTTLPISQQREVLTSGFINVNPNATLTATTPGSSSASAAVASLGTPLTAGTTSDSTSGSSSSIIFTVSQPQAPLNALVIMLPGGLKFDSKNQFKIISETRKNLVMNVDYYPDADNNPNNPKAPYLIGPAYSACTANGAQCLIVEFKAPGLGPNDSLVFSKGILNGKVPATLQQLAGAPITFALNLPSPAESTTTSQYITTSELEFNGTMDTASTQNASTTIPPVVTNSGSLGGPGATRHARRLSISLAC